MRIPTRIFWNLLGITFAVGLAVYSGHPILAAVIALALAGTLAVRTCSTVSRPLRQLTEATVAYAAGHQNPVLPSPRNDEIGDLIIAIGVMMKRRPPPDSQAGGGMPG